MMARRFSYTSYSTAQSCPKKYEYKYIRRVPIVESEHNAIIGTTIQFVFEHFYNNEIWRRGPDAQQTLTDFLIPAWKKSLRERKIIWADTKKLKKLKDNDKMEEYLRRFKFEKRFEEATEEQRDNFRKLAYMYFETLEMVPLTFQVIKEEKLLGSYAKSEIRLYTKLDKYIDLNGYVDFLIRRGDDIIIVDGKTSKQKDKYLSKEQLNFYALMYLLHYQKTPTELAWLFYRYGEYQRVHFEKDDLLVLVKRIQGVNKMVHKNQFGRTPDPSVCKWCPYKELCIKENGPLPTRKALQKKELAVLDDDSDECSF